MRASVPLFPSLLLVFALSACERVTAPEADAAAQTLERLTDPWWRQETEYSQAVDAASGILRRLEEGATRIEVERDGRPETFSAVVFSYEEAAPGAVMSENPEMRRTLVAWQTPGVRNLVLLRVGSTPEPFLPAWASDTTEEAYRSLHDRMESQVLNGRQAYLYAAGRRFWRADGGVATVSPPTTIGQACADGPRREDVLDEFSGMISAVERGQSVPNAVACHAATFTVAFDFPLSTNRHDVSPDTLAYGQFDLAFRDPRSTRLVARPQVVRGVRFHLRCDQSTPAALRPRCPAGTDFAPVAQP